MVGVSCMWPVSHIKPLSLGFFLLYCLEMFTKLLRAARLWAWYPEIWVQIGALPWGQASTNGRQYSVDKYSPFPTNLLSFSKVDSTWFQRIFQEDWNLVTKNSNEFINAILGCDFLPFIFLSHSLLRLPGNSFQISFLHQVS